MVDTLRLMNIKMKGYVRTYTVDRLELVKKIKLADE